MIEIAEKANGMLSPGAVVDQTLAYEIRQLDKEFRHVNFGIPIDESTFEKIQPSHIDEQKNLQAYRDWKKRAIIFKREQLEKRVKDF